MNKLFIQFIVVTCLSFLNLRGMDRVEFEGKQRSLIELIKEANSTPIHPFSSTDLYDYDKNSKLFIFRGTLVQITTEDLKTIKEGNFAYLPFYKIDKGRDIGLIVIGYSNKRYIEYLIESSLCVQLINVNYMLEFCKKNKKP